MSSPPRPPDIEALVAFLPTSGGGRKTAARTGYRPAHLVKDGYLTTGQHEYPLQDCVSPGESAAANIWFLTPEVYPHSMWIGKAIPVQEGHRVVALALVTKILNTALKRPA
jgi:translation elongation factor EF-Tu-like GTPase